MHGCDFSAEHFAERVHGGDVIRVFLVDAVDEDDQGQRVALTVIHHLFGAYADRAGSVRHENRRVHGAHRLFRLSVEIRKTGHVHDVELDSLPCRIGGSERDGYAARDLLLVVIHDGRAVRRLSQTVDYLRVEEHRFREGGFPLSAVSDDCNVPDVLCRNAHKFPSFLIKVWLIPSFIL